MNVCIVTFDYPPHPVYGSGVYVDFLTALLKKAGHRVEIVTVNRFGLIQEKDAVFCKCTKEKEATESGKCLCSFGSMGCLEGLYEKTVERFNADRFTPDVIYLNGYMFFDLAYRLKSRYQKAKLVSAIHYLVEQDKVSETDPERKSIFDEENRMLALSDEIIYFGDLAYDLAKKRNVCDMNKFHLIQHAFNVEISKRTFQKNRRLVYVGRLEPGKGIELLCKALEQIEEAFTFDIIGTGRLYPSIKEKYGNRFTVHGYQNKDFVLNYFQNSDFFFLPSYSEHCPVVVLEGMARGCIPILSDFGSLPQLIRKHRSGLVFDIEEQEDRFVESIKNAVQEALGFGEEKANEMMKTNYRLLQENFSPETMLKSTLAVFGK